ncbi:MAG: primosomal protein N', partial [Oscillospiraceae bacterium]|nr:primosomal protein N' [Candidatus Ruminococcus equi]
MFCVARVAVENTTFSFDKPFDYRIPEDFAEYAQIGCRVLVPFGKSNRKRQGVIISFDNVESTDKLKDIYEVLDATPILSDEMVKMCEYMKSHYFCTYFDAVRAILPAGISYNISDEYSVSVDLSDRIFDLSDECKRIVDFLHTEQKPVKKDKLLITFGYKDSAILDKMVDDGILTKSTSAFRKAKDKTIRMIRLSEDFEDSLSNCKLTNKQNSVLELLTMVGAVSVKEICYYTGVSVSVVDSLVKKNVAEYFDDEVFRIPKYSESSKKDFILTKEQDKAYNELLSSYNEDKGNTALLYGITGSGKTSVFFKLIEHTLSEDKGVIVMVPEIALTPQLISIFKSSFGDNVAVFHSALSICERLDEYKRVKKGLAKIAIGTRSAVFAPVNNLGLIIMDEEQEHTYKSEGKPRFHARDLAQFRSLYNKCLLVLSSATPSIETYYNAQNGRYKKTVLSKRYGEATLPDVLIADMNEELVSGNHTQFSNVLLESIEENLADSKQSILLINRRGHNTFVTCQSCKEPISCPNCSISLTYHSANNRLMCHYCGYSIPYNSVCPTCKGSKLRFMGYGTQRAENELVEIFPEARILRMDTDATMSKSSHEKKLSDFANGKYDILVGTQMVAKGLDFPNVTLVGVLNADQMLYSDDYRSFENTFSLLTQVVGRSGRGKDKGRAIIQTFTPENPIISLASQQNYDEFYKNEILIRKALLYPPFVSLCLVGFVCDNSEKTKKAAYKFAEMFTDILKENHSDIPIRLLGPSCASVFKVNNKYRYKLII